MKKIALTAIAVALGIGVVSYAFLAKEADDQPQPGNSSTASVSSIGSSSQEPSETLNVETVTVTYNDSGFSPQEVTIAKGSTINFVNKSSMPIWVASDPHPEHTDYPEFDTPRAIDRMPKMGEDFSFTFEKMGTWKYHSHTASGDGTDVGVHPGVVIVK